MKLFALVVLTAAVSVLAVPPTAPAGKTWKKVEALSDEFKSGPLNDTKWWNNKPGWLGRPPALFQTDTVSITGEQLRLTPYAFDSPKRRNGTRFTHAGANIWSQAKAKPGDYIEARMEAGQTFMSSSFWLINVKNEGTGCKQRVTELDIQECVGVVTTDDERYEFADKRMASNTHSRHADCDTTRLGSMGEKKVISKKVYDGFQTYGAWWKNSTDIIFYLNNREVYRVQPVALFNIPMYLRLNSNAYNWNPVPDNESKGMGRSNAARSTKFEWVRVWRL